MTLDQECVLLRMCSHRNALDILSPINLCVGLIEVGFNAEFNRLGRRFAEEIEGEIHSGPLMSRAANTW